MEGERKEHGRFTLVVVVVLTVVVIKIFIF
jgi:hypothetical protein